jgi:hypothetical protein
VIGAGTGIAAITSGGSSRIVSETAASSAWSQTGGNAADSRSNLSETTLTPKTVPGLRLLRTYTAPADSPGCTSSVGPVLSGGDVLTLVNGYLVRYVAQTGHVIWQRQYADESDTVTDLAVSDGEVIEGASACGTASDPEGFISAYSLATGKLLWTSYAVPSCQQSGCEAQAGLNAMYTGGGFIVTGGNAVASGYSVAVLSQLTGAVVWKDTSSTCPITGPVVVDQRVIFSKCSATGAPRLVADAFATGARSWEVPGTWTVQRGDFAQSRGRNVLATGPTDQTADLDPRNGRLLGELPGAASVLAADGIRAYATCGATTRNSGQAAVCAYSLATHEQVWSSGPHPGTTLATEAGGVLYLDDGAMLNASTGKSLGTAFGSLAGGVRGMSVGEGRLDVVTATASRLYGLRGE